MLIPAIHNVLFECSGRLNRVHESNASKPVRWLLASVALIGVALLCWPDSERPQWSNAKDDQKTANEAALVSRLAASTKASKQAIENIHVGDRVLAHNPEVSAKERASWQEPDWRQWLELSLSMPKGDGTILNIELLRPESWVREQMGLSFGEALSVPVPTSDQILGTLADLDSESYRTPLRTIYRDLSLIGKNLQSDSVELKTLFVELDLPELAISGPAVVQDIRNAPFIESGEGSVVTATFRHEGGNVIDLVVSKPDEDEGQTRLVAASAPARTTTDLLTSSAVDSQVIGTTSNHPFWSVDRQEYVQAGTLQVGERLQSYEGGTFAVLNKLPKEGPQTVYNLEVYGEHVYYVGEDGLLVHNSKSYAQIAAQHSGGHIGSHYDSTGRKVARTSLSGMAGDHVLPKQAIAEAMSAAGVSLKSKAGQEILAIQDGAKNLRLMDSRLNSSKGARNAVEWMETAQGSNVPRKYIQNILRKQYTNAMEINRILNDAAGTTNVNYFARFFNR